ncbi:MAG: MAPEG family protein [Alphaproteobacteria bacterium]|nr:MAPEG family protein [Alphaproteobacteria bacterium]
MITAGYAGALGLLFLALTVRVIMRRGAVKAALGDGDDIQLRRRIRAHANFVEYVPLTLLLMALVEIHAAHSWLVHAVGLSLLAGRIVHASSIVKEPEVMAGRVAGMLLTLTALALASVVGMASAFGLLG